MNIKMKRGLGLALAGVMLAGCGSSSTAEKPASDNDDNTFVVGFDAEFPPYGYKDENGEYTGFDLEMAQAVADMEGWTLVKQPIDWDAKDMELSSGAIDCIWNGFTMTGREDDYTWTTPYIDNSQVYVVASDSGIESAEDLKGKVVGVQKDSSALKALESEDNKELRDSLADLTQYGDYNTAFMDLEAGAIDALAMDVAVADYQIGNRGDAFKKLDDKLASETYAVGFLKGNTELRDKVQADIYKLYDDGTMEELADKYGVKEFLVVKDYEK